MEYGKERNKTIALKIQDFTPFIGSLFYQARNWRDTRERGALSPTPYNEYILTFIPLSIINVLSGALIVKGLESLLNQV